MTAGVTNVGLKFLSYAFATFNRRERNTFNPYCLLTSLLVSSQVTPSYRYANDEFQLHSESIWT